MAYQVISQNNTTTTLADENGNVIHVPARVSLATSTDYTITKVNNNTATLEDGNGNIIRDVPCVAVLYGEGGGGGGAVNSVNGKTGNVVLNAKDVHAVPQYTTMPTADSSNLGNIVQFSGTTDATYTNGYFYVNKPTYTDSSATISQTTGSGLTDLAVDVATFESAEQPSGDENVAFTASVTTDTSVVVEATPGLDYTFDGAQVMDYFNNIWGYHDPNMDTYVWGIDYVVYTNDGWVVSRNQDGSGAWNIVLPTGITINSTPNVSDYIKINNTMGGTTWTKGGNTVTLGDYGISFTGNPTDGDVLTVAYTAPVISGYAWEQIDVQPSSGGGQTVEYTDVDYVYGTDPSEMSLYFEFANLPTGDYYFYVKSKKQVGSWAGTSYKYQTNKISFHWDSTWQDSANLYDMCKLIGVTPVLDGDYYGGSDGSNMFNVTSSPFSVYYVGDNSNKYALKLNGGGLIAATSSIYEDMPAVYKVSKLYGGATPATLTANKIGRWDTPTGYNSYGDGGNTTPIIPPTYLPDKQAQETYIVSTLGQTDNILVIYGAKIATNSSAEAVVQLKCSCEYGEFIGDVIYTPNGGSAQQILKATGPFANSRLYAYMNNSYGNVYLSLDNAAFAALQNQNANVNAYAAIFGSLGTYNPSLTITQDQNLVSKSTLLPLAISKPTYVMNTPTIHEYKGVIQYVGETDANYTKGYFYEATGTIVTTPATYVIGSTSPDDVTITCTDADGLVNAIATRTTWTPSYVKEMLVANNGLSVNYDFDNSTIIDMQIDGVGVLDSSEYVYFTVSGNYAGTMYVYASSTIFTDASMVVQNGSWDRVDVQPGGLVNTATGTESLTILGDATTQNYAVNIGVLSQVTGQHATAVGRNAKANRQSVAIGSDAQAGSYSIAIGGVALGSSFTDPRIAIGRLATSGAAYAIQIGADQTNGSTNSDAKTVKIYNGNGNFEIMDANGNLPPARLATVPSAAGTYTLQATVDAQGNVTLAWV